MDDSSLFLELYARSGFDRRNAVESLEFLLHYAGGIFVPQECGVYEPFEPFDHSALDRYAGWMLNPGGEFGFRRSAPSPSVEGHLLNRTLPEVLYESEVSGAMRQFKPGQQLVFRTCWTIRTDPTILTCRGAEFMRNCLHDFCRVAHADYGFVATGQDYRNKNFLSIRKNNSETQEYVGDDPDRGTPGLYWINFFGAVYVDHFGREKISAVSQHTPVTWLPEGGVCLRFGNQPEESRSDEMLERQRVAIQTLGPSSFFDIRQPERTLDVPRSLLGD